MHGVWQVRLVLRTRPPARKRLACCAEGFSKQDEEGAKIRGKAFSSLRTNIDMLPLMGADAVLHPYRSSQLQ